MAFLPFKREARSRTLPGHKLHRDWCKEVHGHTLHYRGGGTRNSHGGQQDMLLHRGHAHFAFKDPVREEEGERNGSVELTLLVDVGAWRAL